MSEHIETHDRLYFLDTLEISRAILSTNTLDKL